MSPLRMHRRVRAGGGIVGLAALAVLVTPAFAAPAGPALSSPGGARLLDVLALPGPTLTTAPASPTNVAAPTFAWTGTQALSTWQITDSANTVVATNTGPETTATPAAALTDGAYTFTVWQHDTPDGVPSQGTTHSFTVDATSPAPPRITARPPFPTSVTTPAFSLDGFETGAAASWLVVAAGGAVAQGPQPVTGPTVTLSALTAGSYVFQVRQTDPAGNQSPPASEPFAIVAATVVPTPTATRTRLVLPKMHTKRLRPRVGSKVPTVRPVLTWARGPKGTTLYNVQVFRVGSNPSENAATVQLTKLRSIFPRSRQVRLRGLKPGQCYVWRVWPYVGSKFTAKPLGVSNFCVTAAPRRATRG